MKRLACLTISTVSALLMSALVLAQDAKTTTVTVEVKAQDVQKEVKVRVDEKRAGNAKDKAEADDKALEPMLQQFLPQLRPLFRTELHFVATLCNLTKEQREAFSKETDALATEAAKTFAKSQQAMQQGRNFGSNLDPRAIIQAAMLKLVKDRLAPDQAARYTAEVDKRAADRKQVAIRNIVAQMDIDLILTAEQRDRISESLSKNWNDTWGQSLEVFLYGAQFLPNIPAKLTDPFLNDAQKKVWRDTPRGQNIFFGGIGFLGNMVLDVDIRIDGAAQGEVVIQGVGITTDVAVDVKAVAPKADEPKKADAKTTEENKKVEAKPAEPKSDKKA